MLIQEKAIELIKEFVQEQTGITFPYWVDNYSKSFTPDITFITLEELTKKAVSYHNIVFASTQENAVGQDITQMDTTASAFLILGGNYYIYNPVLTDPITLREAALANISNKVKEIVGIEDLAVHNTKLLDISCGHTKYTLGTVHKFLKEARGKILVATNDPELIPRLEGNPVEYLTGGKANTQYTYVVYDTNIHGYTFLYYFVGTNN